MIEHGFNTVGAELEAVRLGGAIGEAMKLATALKAIDSLKILFAPFLPFSSKRLHRFFGYGTPRFGEQYTEGVTDSLGTHKVLRYKPIALSEAEGAVEAKWKPSDLKPGRKLNQPRPLFKKLEESVIEEEQARLGK